MNYVLAAPFLAASLLLMRAILRASRRPRLIELSRFAGNDAALAAYESRRDALGHGAVRNVRDTEETA